MKRTVLVLLGLIGSGTCLWAETQSPPVATKAAPPAKAEPAAEQAPPENTVPKADAVAKLTCRGQTREFQYRVYLPKDYFAERNKDRSYPTLVISAEEGDADLKPVESWVRRNQWIVILFVGDREGPWRLVKEHFETIMRDCQIRFRIHKEMIVAMGFGEAAPKSSQFARLHKGIHAVVQTGATSAFWSLPKTRKVFLGTILGVDDVRFRQVRHLIKKCPKPQLCLQIQPTGHEQPMPRSLAWVMEWVQKRLCLSTTLDPATAEAIFALYEARFAVAKTPWQKFCIRKFQKELIASARLYKTKEQKERKKQVTKEFFALKKERAVTKEFAAQKAYEVLRMKMAYSLSTLPTRAMAESKDADDYGIRPPTSEARTKTLEPVKDAVEAFVKKYEGTATVTAAQTELDMYLKAHGLK